MQKPRLDLDKNKPLAMPQAVPKPSQSSKKAPGRKPKAESKKAGQLNKQDGQGFGPVETAMQAQIRGGQRVVLLTSWVWR